MSERDLDSLKFEEKLLAAELDSIPLAIQILEKRKLEIHERFRVLHREIAVAEGRIK